MATKRRYNAAVQRVKGMLELRRKTIPTDNFKPLNIAQLCANDEEAPYDAPLHPGAARFYRERGYVE